jgi:hypothetical protein
VAGNLGGNFFGRPTATIVPVGDVLAITYYAPDAQVDYTGPGAGLNAIVDAANLAATFTVPASGAVYVRLTAYCTFDDVTGGRSLGWCLFDSTPALVGDHGAVVGDPSGSTEYSATCSMVLRVAGLTPGSTETLYWGIGGPGGGNFNANYMHVGSTAGQGGDAYTCAPATMEVIAG